MEKLAKTLVIGVGTTLGGLIPVWLGASYFSIWGILGSIVGGIVTLYAFRYFDL